VEEGEVEGDEEEEETGRVKEASMGLAVSGNVLLELVSTV
jgi:hypothetical protein